MVLNHWITPSAKKPKNIKCFYAGVKINYSVIFSFLLCFRWIDPFKNFLSFKARHKQFLFLFCHCPWRGCLKVDTISLQNPSPHQNLWYWSLQVSNRNCQQSEYISIAVFLNFGVNINLWTWSIRKCHTRLYIHFCIVFFYMSMN